MPLLGVNHADVYFEERGNGPAIIFLNGLLGNTDGWKENIVPVLSQDYRCILMNYRGQEKSIAQKPFLYQDLIQDLIVLLNHLKLSKLYLIADAFGAGIALGAASAHPHYFKGLVLSSCASVLDYNLFYKMRSWLNVLQKTDLDTVFDMILGDLHPHLFLAKIKDQIPVLKSKLTGQKNSAQIRLLFESALQRREPVDFTAIKCPITILQGKEDRIIPPMHGRNLKKLLPQAHYQEIKCGHGMIFEQPTLYLKYCLNLLRR